MILVFCLSTLLSTSHLCNSRGTQIQKATFYSSPVNDAITILEKNSVTCKAIFLQTCTGP